MDTLPSKTPPGDTPPSKTPSSKTPPSDTLPSDTLPRHIYAVILAGGSGTRFWPRSRQTQPKQLCRIGSADQTMLETTLARLDGFIPPERRIIITHKSQLEKTRALVDQHCGHFIAEPEARNTANALALGALQIKALYRQHSKLTAEPASVEQPVMVSLHADHLIEREQAFRDALREGIKLATAGYLTLLGVRPRYPETGYGYIENGDALGNSNHAYTVRSFREKPGSDLADQYVKSGNFLWNTGLFVWQCQTVLEELRQRLPPTVSALESLFDDQDGFLVVDQQHFAAIYKELPKVSIDHAVLEVSRNVAVVACDLGWQDVGSWDALRRSFPTDDNGNYQAGDTLLIDCHNATVDSAGPFIGVVGLRNLIVVADQDAVLVCPEDRAQEVKILVDQLKAAKRHELL